MELEKKTWIEMKDMIFETDPNILEYLSYHCKRWRMTQKNGLSEDFNKLKTALHGSSRGAKGANASSGSQGNIKTSTQPGST